MKYDYPKLVIQFLDLWVENNVGSENWSKLDKNTRVNIYSKMGTESQSRESSLYHNQVQSH